MSKVEKEMAESAESVPEGNLDELDLRLVLQQRLESLRWSGIEVFPTAQQEYQFEFPSSDLETDLDSSKGPSVVSSDSAVVTSDSAATANTSPATESVEKQNLPDGKEGSAQVSAVATPEAVRENLNHYFTTSLPVTEKAAALKVIEKEVAQCMRCDELCRLRTKTVFGVGTEKTRLVFVGEGPGAEEDRKGEPFVGAAGQLLDKILAACQLSRSEVYILNTVKCRPPRNRNPSQTELANCWGYAERQLEIIQPDFICCLGSVAAKTLLQTTQSLGRLRRQFHNYRGSRVLVTYHPAYLLRTPSAKKHVWEDMKMLMREMGVDLSKK